MRSLLAVLLAGAAIGFGAYGAHELLRDNGHHCPRGVVCVKPVRVKPPAPIKVKPVRVKPM